MAGPRHRSFDIVLVSDVLHYHVLHYTRAKKRSAFSPTRGPAPGTLQDLGYVEHAERRYGNAPAAASFLASSPACD